MTTTRELPTATRLGKTAQSASFFVYAISTSLLSPDLLANGFESQRNYTQIRANTDIFSQVAITLPNTTLNLKPFEQVIGDLTSTATVFNSDNSYLESKPNLKYSPADLTLSLNQGLVMKVASKMFEKSIDLTELELLVLKKTFKKSIKYAPSLSRRK